MVDANKTASTREGTSESIEEDVKRKTINDLNTKIGEMRKEFNDLRIAYEVKNEECKKLIAEIKNLRQNGATSELTSSEMRQYKILELEKNK